MYDWEKDKKVKKLNNITIKILFNFFSSKIRKFNRNVNYEFLGAKYYFEILAIIFSWQRHDIGINVQTKALKEPAPHLMRGDTAYCLANCKSQTYSSPYSILLKFIGYGLDYL